MITFPTWSLPSHILQLIFCMHLFGLQAYHVTRPSHPLVWSPLIVKLPTMHSSPFSSHFLSFSGPNILINISFSLLQQKFKHSYYSQAYTNFRHQINMALNIFMMTVFSSFSPSVYLSSSCFLTPPISSSYQHSSPLPSSISFELKHFPCPYYCILLGL